jgi:outer membrane lipoprotein-sorting protein
MYKTILAVLLAFFVSNAFAQTADEVINNYITAIGGMDKINSIKSAKMTGKFSAGSMDINFTRTYKRPNKIKMDMQIQGMTMIQSYDGTTAWMLNPFQGSREPEKMPEMDAKYLANNADLEGTIVNYKDKGAKVEFVGKEDMEGTDVYKIKLTDKDGDVNYYFFDATSYLLLKESTKRKMGEKEVAMDFIYGNYKATDGFLYPWAVEIHAPESPMGASQKAVIEKMELNIATEDSDYAMPEKK